MVHCLHFWSFWLCCWDSQLHHWSGRCFVWFEKSVSCRLLAIAVSGDSLPKVLCHFYVTCEYGKMLRGLFQVPEIIWMLLSVFLKLMKQVRYPSIPYIMCLCRYWFFSVMSFRFAEIVATLSFVKSSLRSVRFRIYSRAMFESELLPPKAILALPCRCWWVCFHQSVGTYRGKWNWDVYDLLTLIQFSFLREL